MQIRRIGNYTIIKTPNHKQIYSENRMLQVGTKDVYYVDLTSYKIIKAGKRILKWLKK